MAFNCPAGTYVEATGITAISNLPCSVFIYYRIDGTAASGKRGGFLTSSFVNQTGMVFGGHGSDSSKFLCIVGGGNGTQTVNSTMQADTAWRSHVIVCPLGGTTQRFIRVDDTDDGSILANVGSWVANTPAVLTVGESPGWWRIANNASTDAYSIAVWDIELSESERDQLNKTKYPPFVRPEHLKIFHPMDGMEYNQGRWGSENMAAGGGTPTIVDAPICKRRF